MNQAKKLREEYEQKLAVLQAGCDHPALGDWIEYHWAPGHWCGWWVKDCNVCEKIVHTKYQCDTCEKELIDDEALPGDGHKHPGGMHLCNDCWDKPNRYDILSGKAK